MSCKLNIPEGLTPEKVGRQAVALMDDGLSQAKIARRLKTDLKVLRKMMEIVLLADRNDLSKDERAAVSDAISDMNKTHQTLRAYRLVEKLANTIWGEPITRRGLRFHRAEQRRLDDFDRVFQVLVDMVHNVRRVEVPRLPRRQALEYTEDLRLLKNEITKILQTLEQQERQHGKKTDQEVSRGDVDSAEKFERGVGEVAARA